LHCSLFRATSHLVFEIKTNQSAHAQADIYREFADYFASEKPPLYILCDYQGDNLNFILVFVRDLKVWHFSLISLHVIMAGMIITQRELHNVWYVKWKPPYFVAYHFLKFVLWIFLVFVPWISSNLCRGYS